MEEVDKDWMMIRMFLTRVRNHPLSIRTKGRETVVCVLLLLSYLRETFPLLLAGY